MNARVVNCPQCGDPVEWDTAHPYRPFCSKRCRLNDLGAWASESYRIAVQEQEIDTDSAPDPGEQSQ